MNRVLSAITAIYLVFAVSASTAATAADLSTPEAAVKAYLEGVSASDFDAVLAATAVDRMSKSYDFVANIDRIKGLYPQMSMPATDPLFVAVNKAELTSHVALQIKTLIYGLLTTNPDINGKAVKMDANGAKDLMGIVRGARLSGLKIEKIGIASPAVLHSDVFQKTSIANAKVYGATTMTERVALLSFEGLTFAMGFTIMEYDGKWGIKDQSAAVAGLDSIPRRITSEDFEKLLRDK